MRLLLDWPDTPAYRDYPRSVPVLRDCADVTCWRKCHRAGIGDTGEHHARSPGDLLDAIRRDQEAIFGEATVRVTLHVDPSPRVGALPGRPIL